MNIFYRIRTYALYKLTVMWINENRSFQAFINYLYDAYGGKLRK